ncbi:MAG: methylated-DNA--[protein]-cysteine S-methyltransferase [Prevotella sp.]|jgi:AraC family transcriptional regulator of adaptative response/methylated-DNA-[protein]-cysteine methyltransferase|nr:methylated-DNA--[protein]-cysteine S-methyltransferase [Prevotella sp.]
MNQQNNIDFDRIKDAIGYITNNYKFQPGLDDVAAHVALSPYHLQRMFTEWAGISPKKFLQYISLENAKKILKESRATLFDAAFEVGLSGTGRLHDLFVKIEGMTPGEYKNGGENLTINYSFAETPFGEILIASTAKGICYMAFSDNGTIALEELQRIFPNAGYKQLTDNNQQNALYIFRQDWQRPEQIKLHVKGTDFQLKVWESLLKIPMGKLLTYSDIARQTGNPKASRAVGSAVGDNPIAYLIPCHRVILSSGAFGQYHWDSSRKAAIIGWENVNIHNR